MTDVGAHDREISARRHAAEVVPCMRDHRGHWVVVQRKCNHSAFNGYHWTPSAYSTVLCAEPGGCGRVWRTRAAYVDQLPDAREAGRG